MRVRGGASRGTVRDSSWTPLGATDRAEQGPMWTGPLSQATSPDLALCWLPHIPLLWSLSCFLSFPGAHQVTFQKVIHLNPS